MMEIILGQAAAVFLYEKWQKWDTIASKRCDFQNWKRSPIQRENRRESIVYGNCASDLCWMLRNATDEKGEVWWTKLHT